MQLPTDCSDRPLAPERWAAIAAARTPGQRRAAIACWQGAALAQLFLSAGIRAERVRIYRGRDGAVELCLDTLVHEEQQQFHFMWPTRFRRGLPVLHMALECSAEQHYVMLGEGTRRALCRGASTMHFIAQNTGRRPDRTKRIVGNAVRAIFTLAHKLRKQPFEAPEQAESQVQKQDHSSLWRMRFDGTVPTNGRNADFDAALADARMQAVTMLTLSDVRDVEIESRGRNATDNGAVHVLLRHGFSALLGVLGIAVGNEVRIAVGTRGGRMDIMFDLCGTLFMVDVSHTRNAAQANARKGRNYSDAVCADNASFYAITGDGSTSIRALGHFANHVAELLVGVRAREQVCELLETHGMRLFREGQKLKDDLPGVLRGLRAAEPASQPAVLSAPSSQSFSITLPCTEERWVSARVAEVVESHVAGDEA